MRSRAAPKMKTPPLCAGSLRGSKGRSGTWCYSIVARCWWRATELIRREVPVLLDELDIARMVREQILAFDLERVEYMVRSLIADQLRYIELLGAVLGGVVGLSLPFLNQLL